MSEADCRVGRIDALSAWSRGAVAIDAQVLLFDFHLDIVGLRQDDDTDGGGVDATGSLGLRNPLDAMNAAFILEALVGALALDDG